MMDAWAKANIAGYKSRAADSTTIRLSEANHDATRAWYRDWLEINYGRRVGVRVDWAAMSPREAYAMSEAMFDVANVPQAARNAYYREFAKYIYSLS
ncbi:hypothetical protein AB0J72_38870 [Dactylosporangium sp. NPDC049742]|uniref:hypothetical protein n=1 Tax=Dactylosporangium sp. NPDC049742 TaxID=3154737 RepID=UPI003436E7AD